MTRLLATLAGAALGYTAGRLWHWTHTDPDPLETT